MDSVQVATAAAQRTANLQALAGRAPVLAAQLEQPELPGSVMGWTYLPGTAKDGTPTAQVECDGARHWLHSRYNPKEEAQRIAQQAEIARRGNAVLFGFGLGYLAEALLAELPSNGHLLIIEPDHTCLHAALEWRDLTALLADARVSLLVRPTVQEAFQAWAVHFSLVKASGIAFVDSPNIHKRLPGGFADELATHIRGFMHTVTGNLQTLMVMAHVYMGNTLRAVPHFQTSPGVQHLFGAFGGCPVVCVAAGPSLTATLPLLAQVQDRCLIIACDTSTRPLLKAGITPHLICAGDPQEANHRHIAGLAGEIPSYLCAEPMTYPASLNEFSDRLFIASFRDRLMAWIEEQLGPFGQVLCWGSVATMVFDLARRVGGNPVIFLGQDLSFPGGRTYVPGTYFEDELGHVMTPEAQAERLGDPNLVTVTDIFGNPVQTNRQMFAYHRWFVREIALTDPSIRVINATGGGILKEGLEVLDFATVVEQCMGAPLDAWERLAAAHAAPQERHWERFTHGLQELLQQFVDMEAEAGKAFNTYTEWYRSIHKLGKIPERMAEERLHQADVLRKQIFSYGFATTLIEMADQSGIKSFLNAQQALGGKQANLLVYQEAMEAYLKLFASVIQACKRLRPALREALLQAQQRNVPAKVEALA